MGFSIKQTFEKAVQFLREVKTELKKVTWPSKKDALAGTVIVIITVFIIAFFLWVIDMGLSKSVQQLLKMAAS